MANLPPRPDAGLSTDEAWEAWGQRDPYYGVLTDPRYRRGALTDEARAEFFASGRKHMEHVLRMIRSHADPDFNPRSVLDFGCGVGRLLVPFASIADDVVGIDVSPSMLAEARRNCDALGASAVKLVSTDDELDGLGGRFDLVHSYIVFQHIPTERGMAILPRLLRHLAPAGAGALHFSYGHSFYADTYGLAPPTPAPNLLRRVQRVVVPPKPEPPKPDPDMRMFSYSLTELHFTLQAAGMREIHTEFTDHTGELGVFLFFQAPPAR
jgi:SAM-dependent methyltransferase